MFLYRDAEYHRVGSTNLHQIPVNCPFILSTPNFASNLCTDANVGLNSFVNKFMPSTAEAPYALLSNVTSRQSHFESEGKPVPAISLCHFRQG